MNQLSANQIVCLALVAMVCIVLCVSVVASGLGSKRDTNGRHGRGPGEGACPNAPASAAPHPAAAPPPTPTEPGAAPPA